MLDKDLNKYIKKKEKKKNYARLIGDLKKYNAKENIFCGHLLNFG